MRQATLTDTFIGPDPARPGKYLRDGLMPLTPVEAKSDGPSRQQAGGLTPVDT